MLGVYNIFSAVAESNPDDLALVSENERITYRELAGNVNRLAWGLESIGIRAEAPVGLLLINSRQFVESFYALNKLGSFVAPLNTRLSPKELSEYISLIGCSYVICGKAQAETVSYLREKHPDIIWIGVECEGNYSYEALIDNSAADWSFCEDLPGDAEVLALMTGGSTGKSKAAVHTKEGLLMQVVVRCAHKHKRSLDHGRGAALVPIPMFHIGGLCIMLDTFGEGGTVVLSCDFRTEKIMRIIEEERICSMLLIPPSLGSAIYNNPNRCNFDLSSVRSVGIGGSRVTAETLSMLFEVFPNATADMLYTSSEYACVISAELDVGDLEKDLNLGNLLGKPYPFSQLRLVDNNGRDVKRGEVGELWAKGIGMMKRYIHDENASHLIDGWLPTGDLMYMDDAGNYYFADRKKDMVKSGGENVYTNEVESVILRHPAVAECAVFGLPDAFYMEIVAAAIVLKPGEAASEEEIVSLCKNSIASYKKPRKVFFLDKLPKSSLGKTQKFALREKLAMH